MIANIMDELCNNVFRWALDRNLVSGSNPKQQMLKLAEEVGELSGAIARGNDLGIKDGIGDAMVVLIIMAHQIGSNPVECLALAYREIEHRKGKMVDGVFIKENE